MTDIALTARQLERLPRLAQQAHIRRPATSNDDAEPTSGSRGRLGPRLPSGVGSILSGIADAEDCGRELPGLLARISRCIRVVQEELDRATLPDPGAEGTQTWGSECAWLLTTIEQWGANDWCAEWIAGEVADVELVLANRFHTRTGRCAICDVHLEVHTTGPLISAICPQCDRVASMRLTVSPETYQRWQQEQRLVAYRTLLAEIAETGC